MLSRRLPGTDINLSVLCFGTFGLRPSNPYALDSFDAALDAGIDTIHSAPEYRSFEYLSRHVQTHRRRSDLRHIVKFPNPGYGEDRFDTEAFRRQVDDVLRALGAERIAVVQHLHRGPASPHTEYDARGDRERLAIAGDVLESLGEVAEELTVAGKIGSVVAFPHTMAYAKEVIDGPYAGLAHYWGPLENEVFELFDDLRRTNGVLVGIRPLLRGLLTTAGVDREHLDRDSILRTRRWNPWYQRLEAVKAVIDEPASWTEFALRFAITPDVVATSVVAFDTVEHVETAVRGAELGPLAADVVTRVCNAIRLMPPIKPSTVDAPRRRSIRGVVGGTLERVPGGRTLKRKLAGR